MKHGYSLITWFAGHVHQRPYSREELAVTLRSYRRDGMRGWQFTYPHGTAYAGVTVQRKAFGWLIKSQSTEGEIFIKRDDAPF